MRPYRVRLPRDPRNKASDLSDSMTVKGGGLKSILEKLNRLIEVNLVLLREALEDTENSEER